MVILHIVAPGEIGGLERVVQALATGHRALGHEVHVAAVLEHSPDHPFLAPLALAGVVVHALVLPARAYGRERRGIAALCRRLKPNVVHTHGYRPDVVDGGVARRAGIPVVTTVHGFTRGGLKNRVFEWLQRAALRRFDAVMPVARPLAEELRQAGVPTDRIHFVPNAWQQSCPALDRAVARAALGVPDNGFHIGWVGRVSPEKGLDLLLEALPSLTDVPCTVSVVGDGREQAALLARAQALGVDGRILWHGSVPNAERLFSAFDVFVLSSRTEGTPIVLFEAMAAGVPVVAALVGGVPDVVSAAEAALVPPEDPIALAREIRKIFRSPELGAARAAAARTKLARDFRVKPWLRRYQAIYAAAISRPRSGAWK